MRELSLALMLLFAAGCFSFGDDEKEIAAASRLRPDEYRILALKPETRSVMIGLGADQGAQREMVFELRRQGRPVGEAVVVEVFDDMCRAECRKLKVKLTTDDVAYSPEPAEIFTTFVEQGAQPGKLRARVTEVHPEAQLIILDKGTRDGVRRDMWFSVFNRRGFKANVRIRSAYETISSAVVPSGELTVAVGDVAESVDKVKAAAPPRPMPETVEREAESILRDEIDETPADEPGPLTAPEPEPLPAPAKAPEPEPLPAPAKAPEPEKEEPLPDDLLQDLPGHPGD